MTSTKTKHSKTYYIWFFSFLAFITLAIIFSLVAFWVPGVSSGAGYTGVMFWLLGGVAGLGTGFMSAEEEDNR